MKTITRQKWFYPVVYLLIFLLSMAPLVTEKPYDYSHPQDVIMSVLRVSLEPYAAKAPMIKGLFVMLLISIVLRISNAERILPAFIGVDYILIAVSQNAAVTEEYGYAVLTGSMAISLLLGFSWLWVAWRRKMDISPAAIPRWRWLLLPLALLAFWAPYRMQGMDVMPDFNPLLLATSPDFGMTFCLTTPVFLFLLILFYPRVHDFSFRITAFSGLLYGLYNLSLWFTPGTAWMGLLHLPLQVISLIALLIPWLERRMQQQSAG